jgi:3D (Asp-Asp-Asp) domain-containing protein
VRGLLTAAMLPAFLGFGYAFFTAPRNAMAAELQSGSTVTVIGTEGSGLRIRSAPGIGSKVLATVTDGSRLQILDGPEAADGLEWYKVKSESNTGWSNAKYLTATPPDRAPKSATAYESELAAPAPPVPSGARVFVSKTTAYATGNKGVGTRTATGTGVRWGTVSVDPSVIPFGSQLLIDGFDGTVFTAEDRGSGIKGAHVDIFFPEPAVAGKYGTQQRKVTIVREGYGR